VDPANANAKGMKQALERRGALPASSDQ
jgi:hypothetical protein